MALRIKLKEPSVIPGFNVTMGFTLLYLLLIVLIPLSGLFIKTYSMNWHVFLSTVTNARVMSAYRVSFGISLIAALVNVFFGFIVAWVLVRYKMPCKKLLDSMIDLPFALPTAVAGIALSALYSPQGWMGSFMMKFGIKVAFTPIGIAIALVFVGLPFIIRTVEPVLKDMDSEIEEAAASLGASRWQVFTKIILPHVTPALLTGFAMAFARGLGEYGSVIFIAGNLPNISEIVPLIIITKLEQYDYAGATAIALTMLIASFILLLAINMLQRWSYGVTKK